MELDDQLAALAAGELDDDDARVLRVRAAADPVLAQRLARHEQLEQLLTTWEAPPLSDDAVARIDAAIDDALDDLGEEPLAGRPDATGPLTAVPATSAEPTSGGSPADGRGQVGDLAAARQRRAGRRGLPAWVPGATVAAALVAVVGIGVVSGLGSGRDDGAVDTMADAPVSDSAQEAADSEMAETDESAEVTEESALAPAQPDDVVLAEGELLALLDAVARSDDGAGVADEDAVGDREATADACVVEALERDTVAVDGREVAFLARGSYADQPAQFVVVRTPTDGFEQRIEVLAYDPGDCTLLARDETVR